MTMSWEFFPLNFLMERFSPFYCYFFHQNKNVWIRWQMEGLHLYSNQLRTNSHVCMHAHLCVLCAWKLYMGHMVPVYTLLYACSVCLAENCMCGSFLCVSNTQSVLCVHMVCVLVWICWHHYATTELKVKQFSITCPKSSCLTAFWSLT